MLSTFSTSNVCFSKTCYGLVGFRYAGLLEEIAILPRETALEVEHTQGSDKTGTFYVALHY